MLINICASRGKSDQRLEVTGDKIYRSGNVLAVGDVHIATRNGIFLDVAGVRHDDVLAGIMGSITLTVRTSIVKYLRGGTRVASPTKLKTSRTLEKNNDREQAKKKHTQTLLQSTT